MGVFIIISHFSHPPNIISYGIPRSPLRILANRIVGSFFGGSKLYNIIWLKSPINYPKLSHFKIACRTHIEENKIYWKRQAMKRWPNYWKSWRPHGTGDITCQEPSTILCTHTTTPQIKKWRFCQERFAELSRLAYHLGGSHKNVIECIPKKPKGY